MIVSVINEYMGSHLNVEQYGSAEDARAALANWPYNWRPDKVQIQDGRHCCSVPVSVFVDD